MNPVGITFIPNQDNQQQGPLRGSIEANGGSDLTDAFKILSLRLPQVLGAQSLAPKRLLGSQGSAAIPGAFDPQTAIFEALLRNALGGGGGSLASLVSGGGGSFGGESAPGLGGATRIIPGDLQGSEKQSVFTGPDPTPTSNSFSDYLGGSRDFSGDNLLGRRRA